MTLLTRIAAATPDRPPPRRPSRLLRAGLVAGPLFTAGYLVAGALRGDGYSPARHPVSSLALGPHGWTQIVGFVVCGVLVLVCAAGVRRSLRGDRGAVALPVTVALWGVGLLGAGVFPADPIGGYPTAASPQTWHGQLHDLAFSLPGFVALALAMVVAAVVSARWFAVYSAISAVVFGVLLALASSGFAGVEPWADAAGLWQRLGLTVGWSWLAVLSVLPAQWSGAQWSGAQWSGGQWSGIKKRRPGADA